MKVNNPTTYNTTIRLCNHTTYTHTHTHTHLNLNAVASMAVTGCHASMMLNACITFNKYFLSLKKKKTTKIIVVAC